MGVQLLDGRRFNEADNPTGEPVAIVDDMLAHRFWPNQRAIGQHLAIDSTSVGLSACAVAACWIPARRALANSPVQSLRTE